MLVDRMCYTGCYSYNSKVIVHLFEPTESQKRIGTANTMNLRAHVSFAVTDASGHPPTLRDSSSVLVCDWPITNIYLS